MSGVKTLAKDTAVYGMSSIIGRFLNWCLVPLYTIMFPADQYGLVTYIYSIVALALVILTYGMETGFFRFSNHERYTDAMEVYSTSLISLGVSSSAFILAVCAFAVPLSHALECGDHYSYVILMGATVGIDAFTAIPFSYLRFRHRAMRFALLRIINIGLNIGLNLFFILLCPWLWRVAPQTISWFYDPGYGIGYIFLANFITSVLNLLLLLPELRGFRWRFNGRLWREMIWYSLPLLVLGVAGIMNQTIDKIMLPDLVADKADGMTSYRDAMKWFVVFSMVIFLGVMFYLDVLRYFISPAYFSGLKVVPVIMIAEFFFGVFFNLSLWYKLTDRTHWGMWFSLLGLVVTIALNILLVPRLGYMGCAWAALACYFVMMATSYFVGRAKYPIGYDVVRIGGYFLLAMGLYVISVLTTTGHHIIDMAVRTVMLLLYVWVVLRVEHMTLGRLLPVGAILRKFKS